jgi:hypothetical protein
MMVTADANNMTPVPVFDSTPSNYLQQQLDYQTLMKQVSILN